MPRHLFQKLTRPGREFEQAIGEQDAGSYILHRIMLSAHLSAYHGPNNE